MDTKYIVLVAFVFGLIALLSKFALTPLVNAGLSYIFGG